jgi:hypothetical protein
MEELNKKAQIETQREYEKTAERKKKDERKKNGEEKEIEFETKSGRKCN